MADQRVLMIESPCHISVDTGRIVFRKIDGAQRMELASDLAVLCLHHEQITISHHALRVLGQSDCAVIITDGQHMPSAVLHPLSQQASSVANTRLMQQIALLQHKGRQALIWQQLVTAKVHNGGAVLRQLGLNGAVRMERLAQQVQPDDATHIEGQAAKHFWQCWFTHPRLAEHGQKRQKQDATDPVNARLNYAYAMLRTSIARELIASGLNPSLGVGHHNQGNPFNLADDFIEPYRCIAEWAVAQLTDIDQPFTGNAKQNLLKALWCDLILTHDDNNRYRLAQAITQTVRSYCQVLEMTQHAVKLKLPKDWFTS
ncbi:CRISPR-associated endonuclease Cas1 [Ephemeroptericola cinctiostellae]|uniref:CRISPR-associated endonuclease Cas1 n=1 Tax=Ephemeroptericola cinctiostellae TaxID=2268024 RepID=A0A345DB22_9BURK|nr:type II CRISPR-associated endonuclease Cas1 [Ephemeroptericola cinctiostellae]AXF85560.1 CRISPR-associated endonuclease Cas1 [Ephemeroptericola cinctiostellae]